MDHIEKMLLPEGSEVEHRQQRWDHLWLLWKSQSDLVMHVFLSNS
jgi:hypothetical protein